MRVPPVLLGWYFGDALFARYQRALQLPRAPVALRAPPGARS